VVPYSFSNSYFGVYWILTFKRYLNISNNLINKMRGDNMTSPKTVLEKFNNVVNEFFSYKYISKIYSEREI
jgi:hypothetical protein